MDPGTEIFSSLAKTANGIAFIALLVGLALAVVRRTRRLAGTIVTVAGLTWAAVLCVTAASMLGTLGRWWVLGAGVALAALLHVAIHRRARWSLGAGVLAALLGLPLVTVLDAVIRGERGLQSGRLLLPVCRGQLQAMASPRESRGKKWPLSLPDCSPSRAPRSSARAWANAISL